MHHYDLRVEGAVKGAALLRSNPRSPEPTREDALLGIGPRLTDHRGLIKCSHMHGELSQRAPHPGPSQVEDAEILDMHGLGTFKGV